MWISTNQQTARKPISAGISTHGRNRSSNGRVIARVTLGSVTRTFQRSDSSGLDFGGALSSKPGEQALRGELLADLDDVLGLEPAPEPLRHRGGERVHVALAVDLLEQPVHERPELDHLPVGAAGEPGAVLVARAADLAEQLEALRARQGARRVGRRGRCGPRSGPVDGRAHP